LQEMVDEGHDKYIPGAHILRTLEIIDCLHLVRRKKENPNDPNCWQCYNALGCLCLFMKKQRNFQMRKLNARSFNKNKDSSDNEEVTCYAYCVQPRKFLNYARMSPGAPTLWFYQGNIVLDALSPVSLKFIESMKDASILSIQRIPKDVHMKEEVSKFLKDLKKNDDIDTGEIESEDEPEEDEPEEDHNLKAEEIESLQQLGLLEHSKGRIRYEPTGGFDMSGLPPKKKRRIRKSKRKRKSKGSKENKSDEKENKDDENENKNDGNDLKESTYNTKKRIDKDMTDERRMTGDGRMTNKKKKWEPLSQWWDR